MARTEAIEQANHAIGIKNSLDIIVPSTAEKVRIYARRDAWPERPGEVCKVVLDLSLDNGTNWILNWVGFGARGGDKFEPDGTTPVVESYVQRSLIGIGSSSRLVRVSLNIPAALKTKIEVEFL